MDRDLDYWHESFSLYNFCADILETLAPYRSLHHIYFIDRNNCSDDSIEVATEFFAFIESYPLLGEKPFQTMFPVVRSEDDCFELFPSPLGEKPFQTIDLKAQQELTEIVSIPSRGKAFPDSSSEEPYPARVPEAKSTHLFSSKKIYSDPANFRG